MKKILFVFGGEKSSGAEFVIERLIRNWHQGSAYLLIAPGNFSERLSKESLPYKLIINKNLKKLNKEQSSKTKIFYHLIKNLIFLNRYVFKFIIREKINIVHTNTLVPTIYLIPSRILMKIFNPKVKWIWSDHDLDYAGSTMMNKIAPFIVRLYDKTLVVSNAVLNKYSKNLHGKINVLYNGLDFTNQTTNLPLNENLRVKFSIPSNSKVFGIMGQIVPRKGVLKLIEVFVKNFGNDDRYTLMIAGSPLNPNDSYYQQCLNQAKSCSNIIFTGYIANVDVFYQSIDFLINNSSQNGSEPLGTTILEGMSYKKTVLASNVGGSKEIIDSDKVGILYQPDSEKALLDAINKSINFSSEEIEKIGSMAQKRIQENFNISQMTENYQIIIESLKYSQS